MNRDNNCYDCFNEVADEALLACHYDALPAYIAPLKAVLTAGHYILVSINSGNRFVAEILQVYQSQLSVCLYLPLYADETKPYIHNPALLPLPISHPSFQGVVELVKTAYTANVDLECVCGIAFVFLAEDIMNYLFHVEGMQDAFTIRFKFCPIVQHLVPLNHSSFFCFPDVSPVHQSLWSACYGRSIFSAIDGLRQELWRFLCRYGGSQGSFPKGVVKLNVPSIFTHYCCKFFHDAGVPSQVLSHSEPNRRIEQYLIYRMVSITNNYRYFSLETEERLKVLAAFLGTMSMFGIRTRMPRRNAEKAVRVMDAVNCISKAELFVGLTQVKVRIKAFKHIVGQPTENAMLAGQIQPELPREHPNNNAIQTRSRATLRIGSKFDSSGSLYEVLELLPNGNVVSRCLWGGNVGSEVVYSCEEVLRLVNQKRG